MKTKMSFKGGSASLALMVFLGAAASRVLAQENPGQDAFRVLDPAPSGPRIDDLLRYQLDIAWRQDEERLRKWSTIRTEGDVQSLQAEIRRKLLDMIGGLPSEKTPLHAQVTGKIQQDGYSIDKLIFESQPGVYVTALVYSPDDRTRRRPAVLVPAGHSTNGKIHYQGLCQRLVARGYVVIAWDPIGQGERSQFWDKKTGKSRYNLVCAEHAVMGNLAYLAGANLARWEIWDGIRAVDYLLTRSDVDNDRISITGTSGGGTQTTLIAALDERIKVVIPSCYISALPMRMGNRIFADPDSDPEQDLYGMIANGVDHAGLLLLMYPRPVMVVSAVLDFFPIEGTRRTFRETQHIYEQFGLGNRIAMAEGYHKHEYSVENQENAMNFLDRFNHNARQERAITVKDLSDRELWSTKSGQVMEEKVDARPLTELIRDYYQERKGKIRKNFVAEYQRGERGKVNDWSFGEFRGAPPGDQEILWESRGKSEIDGIVVEKFLLHHSRLLGIPLLYVHRTAKTGKELLLWTGEHGKARPEDWKEIKARLDAGYDVLTFDPRGLGETKMAYTAVSPDDPALGKLDFDQAYENAISGVLANHVYNSLLSGRPYFFQAIEDAEISRTFAKKRLGREATAVAGKCWSYTLASGIGEILNLKLLTQSGERAWSWAALVEGEEEVWPIELLVPGGAYFQ